MINIKHRIGDSVYFFDGQNIKLIQTTIEGINVKIYGNNEGNYAVTYSIGLSRSGEDLLDDINAFLRGEEKCNLEPIMASDNQIFKTEKEFLDFVMDRQQEEEDVNTKITSEQCKGDEQTLQC